MGVVGEPTFMEWFSCASHRARWIHFGWSHFMLHSNPAKWLLLALRSQSLYMPEKNLNLSLLDSYSFCFIRCDSTPAEVLTWPVLHNLLVTFPAQTAFSALGVLKAALRWNNTAGIDMQIRTLSLRQESSPSFILVLKKKILSTSKGRKVRILQRSRRFEVFIYILVPKDVHLSNSLVCSGYPEGWGGTDPLGIRSQFKLQVWSCRPWGLWTNHVNTDLNSLIG